MVLTKLKWAAAAVIALGVTGLVTVGVARWAGVEGHTKSQITVDASKEEQAWVGLDAVDTQTSKEPVKAAPKDQQPKPKVFEFEFSSAPWAAVLDWLKDQIELPLATIYRPTGSFTFVPIDGPDGKKKLYTIPEAIDVINQALLPQKLMIIRRTATFTVWPADGPIPPDLIPFIEIADLPSRGKTEIVKIDYRLQTVLAKKHGPELSNKLKGPFGTIVLPDDANRLILVDCAANLRKIITSIDELGGTAVKK